jgi:hypothetical protein
MAAGQQIFVVVRLVTTAMANLQPLFEAWNQVVHVVSDDPDTDIDMDALDDALLQLGMAIKALSDAATMPTAPPALIRQGNNFADN